MTSINDFATTYMCQSLPFGGVKESGFDRFAGIEGLRGLTVPKAVAEDRWPWLMRTDIPPMLQYPVRICPYPLASTTRRDFSSRPAVCLSVCGQQTLFVYC
jgi:Aldehyde dehydrogenase family